LIACIHRLIQGFVILEAVVTLYNHLKNYYLRNRYITQKAEYSTPVQPKQFTSLSLIHHEDEQRTKKEAIAITEATRSGNIDAIMSSSSYMQKSLSRQTAAQEFFALRKTHKFSAQSENNEGKNEEIFSLSKGEDGQKPRSILIEGVSGMGKTVLSKEMSIQWTNGLLLVNEILVFLIFLTDPLVQKITSLKDLVKYYYQFDETSESIASCCAEYLLQSDGHHVTFIHRKTRIRL